VLNPLQPSLFIIRPPDEPVREAHSIQAELHYRSTKKSTRLSCSKSGNNSSTADHGGRYQVGDFHSRNLQITWLPTI
jgi:hypothetical protein